MALVLLGFGCTLKILWWIAMAHAAAWLIGMTRPLRASASIPRTSDKEIAMGEKTDKVAGRIKQATGVLTGNEKLKREGRADERTGRVKQKADKAIDAVRDKLEDAAETLHPSEKEK